MSAHACDGEPDYAEEGFFEARCICGWSQGALPDLETAVDWLMQHARERALIEDAK